MEVDEPFAHCDEIVARQSNFPILSNAALEPDEMDTILVIKLAENTIPHRLARKAMLSYW